MRSKKVLEGALVALVALASCNKTMEPLYTTPAEWMKSYLGAGAARSIQQTADGGYIVAGPGYGLCVLKLGSDGVPSWQKIFRGNAFAYATCIQKTGDGGYIVAANTSSFGAGDNDFWVLKLASDGQVSWQKTYGGSYSDFVSCIQQTGDSGYIVLGYTFSFGAGNTDLWILKLASDGAVSWQKTYGGSSTDYATSIRQTAEGGYIVAGYSLSFGAHGNLWMLKLASDGQVSWQKTYDGTSYGDGWVYDWAFSVRQTTDFGYIIAGYTLSSSADKDLWVLKLASDGAVSWQKTYGGSLDDWATCIEQTADDGYVVAGMYGGSASSQGNPWVLKLASDGQVSWQKTYWGKPPYNSPGVAYSIQKTNDSGYVVAGDLSGLWVLKLTSNGQLPGSRLAIDTSATPASSSAISADTSVSGMYTSATVSNTSVALEDTSASVIVHYP